MVISPNSSVIYLVELHAAILEIVGKAQTLLFDTLSYCLWVGEPENAVLGGIAEILDLPLQISDLCS